MFPEVYPTYEAIGNKVGATHHAVSQIVSAYKQIECLKPKLDPSILTRVSMLPEGVVRPIKSVPESAKYAVVSVIAEKGSSSRESEHLAKVAKANPETSKISLPMLL